MSGFSRTPGFRSAEGTFLSKSMFFDEWAGFRRAPGPLTAHSAIEGHVFSFFEGIYFFVFFRGPSVVVFGFPYLDFRPPEEPLKKVRTLMKIKSRLARGVMLGLLALTASAAQAVTIPTVPIGNAGNAPDNTGYGAVAYDYRIGTTEVTNAQYVAFLNAVAATDTYGLFSPYMESTTWGGITRMGDSGSYAYSVKADAGSYTYANKPVVYVSWGDAARFSNWLHNGQPTGAQNAGTTEDGAYTLNGAVTNAALLAVTRNADATWFLPTENEWYKAAYYDGNTSTYYDFPTGTDATPNNNPPSSDTGNSANFYNNGPTTGNWNYPLTDAGAYTQSASPYDTYDQGGNVLEWNEARFSGFRELRGGAWDDIANSLAASYREIIGPTYEGNSVGFRVATVPEPSSLTLLACAVVALVPIYRHRKRR